MSISRSLLLSASILLAGVFSAFAQPSAYQGFENPADVACWAGDGTITIVPSGGGFYHVMSFDGAHHAEITNQDNAYLPPTTGDSQFTEFCLPPMGYTGDFSQSIAVYINAQWAPSPPGSESFWIDESPRDASGAIADGAGPPDSTFTAEHNFRLTATGTMVLVGADNAPVFATITQSGWYVFQLTWRKDPVGTNPVISDFNVYNAQGVLIGTTTRPAFMVGAAPPLPSSDLGGPGYLWFTVWANGFANDVLAIDAARVGPLGAPPFPSLTGALAATLDGSFQTKIFANLAAGDSVINIGNTGASAAGVGAFGVLTGGNICVNVYVFSPDEQEVACCTCAITPNGVSTVSARQLISKTLTPAVPTAITVKLFATAAPASGTCSAATPGTAAPGLIAFGTNIHAAAVGGSVAAGTFAVTETPFIPSTLSTAELTRISTLCGFIGANGTGFGICPGCTAGAAGAVKQ